MTGHHLDSLVLLGVLSRQLEDLTAEVLKHCSHENTSSDTGSVRVLAFLQITSKATNREDQVGTGVRSLLFLGLATLAGSFACHYVC